jgi:hypothetical protein
MSAPSLTKRATSTPIASYMAVSLESSFQLLNRETGLTQDRPKSSFRNFLVVGDDKPAMRW